jgi:hypothetical protein
METPRPTIAFVVRVIERDGGTLTGTVERVRTGEKRHFPGIESVSRLIEEMTRGEAEDPVAPSASQ